MRPLDASPPRQLGRVEARPHVNLRSLTDVGKVPSRGRGHRGQRRVYDSFLVFAQVRQWLRVLASCVGASAKRTPR